MKKIILTVAFFLVFTSCVRPVGNREGIIEIRERMFLGQLSEIYLNANDYMGRTVKLEGFMISGENNGKPFYAVARFGPGGCCGVDGIVGFEVAWTGNRNQSYPKDNSWVEAVGELKQYSDGFNQFLYLELSSLIELETRGQEYVSQ